MKRAFPLFQSHLDLAHALWARLVQPNDRIVDATSGNGHDALVLARLLRGEKSALWCLDLQEEAIHNSRLLLTNELVRAEFDRVRFQIGCHTRFPEEATGLRLVVYNLGYLPGGDKNRTTMRESTLQSLTHASDRLLPGGALSITCYPGHEEGALEETALLKWSQTLDKREWSCCHHRWTNRRTAPSLLLIQKAIS